ncbi:hypothetical protein GCM10010319_21770 [Streptomyces blastmyceticus]|uniref:Uncharacterized protein n=1 Tax=Streptomyces blastmyceticus TaxID=68180 RepID=A0ABN0WRR9_9ACTN
MKPGAELTEMPIQAPDSARVLPGDVEPSGSPQDDVGGAGCRGPGNEGEAGQGSGEGCEGVVSHEAGLYRLEQSADGCGM